MEQFLTDHTTLIFIIASVIAGAYSLFHKKINAVIFASGKAAGLFLKRFKLDDEVEEAGQAFIDGMKSVDRQEEIKKNLIEKYPTVLSIKVPGEKKE